MPSYAHLARERVDFDRTPDKLRAMRAVGVPYKPEQIASAGADARAAGEVIARGLHEQAGANVTADSELVALIGYLQRLGRVPADPPTPAPRAAGPVAQLGGH
jgi:cbb3-type cytochrome oxidase cytochrome c subunit